MERVTEKHNDSIKNVYTNSAHHGIINQDDFFERKIGVNLKNYTVVRKNNFVYNPRISRSAPVGPMNISNLSEPGVVSPLYTVFKLKIPTLNFFLSYYFLSSKWHRHMLKRANFGARSDRLSIRSNDLDELVIHIPVENGEIERVSHLLKNINEMITLNQENLKKLNLLKQALLRDIFADNKQQRPKIRFKGFTEDWQQHQLKDLVIPVKGNSGDLSLPVLTISAGRGWLSQKERFGQTIAGNSLKRYTELPVGGLAYNRGASRSYWYGVTYVQDQHEKALVPNVYHSFLSKKNVTNELFVQQFFLANLADRELNKIITSSARRDGLLNINQKDFLNIKLFVPQIEEQEKIGEILKSLEKTISLNQSKLDSLQKIKKAYLQNLFI
ncbi:restriction endonuclease subunit S [Dolosicoccus paucivorans]|uniref:Restriction endonuclease subunit S n=1 Tax=Dolosicoccus paucivorans TaxID=84521 RepID=A0A2N6SPX8_9LACT|nr:restriction endonuclease subunit S [Dolosicoccus paucivorans]PMC59122.1 restriction endonuclease subunit S [Dolosicoccus paucivorans]